MKTTDLAGALGHAIDVENLNGDGGSGILVGLEPAPGGRVTAIFDYGFAFDIDESWTIKFYTKEYYESEILRKPSWSERLQHISPAVLD